MYIYIYFRSLFCNLRSASQLIQLQITPSHHYRQSITQQSLPQEKLRHASIKTKILPSLKQPSICRCSCQQPLWACFAGSWCRRQSAQKTPRHPEIHLPPQHTSAHQRQKTQASLGHSRCFPSTKLRRRWIPHKNDTANKRIT